MSAFLFRVARELLASIDTPLINELGCTAFVTLMEGTLSDQLIDAAKQPIIGYNEKDWDKVAASTTPGYVYEEVATHRKAEGIGSVLEIWKEWGAAFPDSKATFNSACVSGNSVIIEVTWNGTQTGPMMTENGEVPPTGKSMSMRAAMVNEMEGGKVALTRQYFDLNTMLSQLGIS